MLVFVIKLEELYFLCCTSKLHARQKIIIIKHKLKLSYFYNHASLIKKSTHVTGTHNKMMDAAVITIPWICLNG